MVNDFFFNVSFHPLSVHIGNCITCELDRFQTIKRVIEPESAKVINELVTATKQVKEVRFRTIQKQVNIDIFLSSKLFYLMHKLHLLFSFLT